MPGLHCSPPAPTAWPVPLPGAPPAPRSAGAGGHQGTARPYPLTQAPSAPQVPPHHPCHQPVQPKGEPGPPGGAGTGWGRGGSRGAWSWVSQGEAREPPEPLPGVSSGWGALLEETGPGQEGSGWGWGQTQRWDRCVPALWLPVKHTQGPRGEAACERRGQAGRREGGPREGWGVRPPPGAPLCPPLPGRAGAARVSSGCDATRVAPMTRAVSALSGPKRPRNAPG